MESRKLEPESRYSRWDCNTLVWPRDDVARILRGMVLLLLLLLMLLLLLWLLRLLAKLWPIVEAATTAKTTAAATSSVCWDTSADCCMLSAIAQL